mmetsp:Transcript_4722/g.16945  ORF Transcript_4722/g.16945 Transcript_4722/m.16945 type:complete len:221 (-) Transcript_4722:1188-1850(-)
MVDSTTMMKPAMYFQLSALGKIMKLRQILITFRRDFTISVSVAPKYLMSESTKVTLTYPNTENKQINGTTCGLAIECSRATLSSPEKARVMNAYSDPIKDAKPSTSDWEEGVSTRKNFFSSKLEQIASIQRAITMRTTPIGLNVGIAETSPRVNKIIPATKTATDKYSPTENRLPLIIVAKIITGTTLADLNTILDAYVRNFSAKFVRYIPPNVRTLRIQ